MNLVKQNAYNQASIRQSKGRCYDHVKSKVARCLKVQKKVLKDNKRKKASPYAAADQDVSEEQFQLNNALSVEQLGMQFGSKNASWVRRTEENMQSRVIEVKQREQEFK